MHRISEKNLEREMKIPENRKMEGKQEKWRENN